MLKVYSRYGIWIALGLIAYFLLLKLIGLHQYPILSSVNGLIFGFGIYMAMKKYASGESKFKYEKGFEVGLLSGGIATIIFTAFMAVYMYQLDTEFSNAIMENWNLEYDAGTLMLVISVLIMGFATSLVLTLAFMQLLKNSWNTQDGNRNTMK
ncbi:DUF4199 domain-containing protein [Aequorivita lipolytica]|uniref:DUF4199 domain-containing protein n=1 Tax=Aequorivita lipolytica TaxID=153267 RepID=A0A5C6YQX9_9FLAO|nr:DUF4199 domain-containing protein [Aequorivita lipolytica]TXD69373.1 DUF4199 domain-containing protein [Aequorivita lipolytica]SRX53724.1 hypothetical protein AEQU2_02955 [Aequorivita lipolytica]